MGAAFFNSWKLWQKMTFVLGVGLVLVIIYGLIILYRNRWRVRKYMALEEAQRVDLERARQTRTIINLNGERLPFGVRALEAGIVTEGVIVSPNVTPVVTPTASVATTPTASIRASSTVTPSDFTSSSRDDRDSLPSRSRLSQLQGGRNLSSGTLSSASSTTASISEKRESAHASPAQGDPKTSLSRSKACRYHPRHYSELRHSSGITRNQEALQALEGKQGRFKNFTKFVKAPLRYQGNKYGPASTSNGITSVVALSSSPNAASPPPRFSFESFSEKNGIHKSSEIEEVDLGLLHNHRISHAAEVGQLVPRFRKPTGDGVSDRIASGVSSAPGVDGYSIGPQTLPSTSLNVIFAASGFNQTLSGSGQSFPSKTGGLEAYKLEDLATSSLPSAGPEAHDAINLPKEVKKGASHASTILRRVNSGFEILVPGTLDLNDAHCTDSADALLGAKTKEDDAPKKLQKKMPMARERSSSFVEHL
ncbi:hypothetical protein L228DRAFT_149734 [Xylona heveae TC161]|uniref:Uncharacterized protein n=1 Tax=Xylona heveae (strain CBS 132557 / TC161) TaxID=1328760 RepID=A0A165GJX0_XYLHT|nr:hypothetical protein L228DRAFT_149734 [Xylona heveae TC161]KZF22282.1 hypothetical protein L228DRAFT_149734 [Xylona heveae TC161]